jgi:hypothetical protein
MQHMKEEFDKEKFWKSQIEIFKVKRPNIRAWRQGESEYASNSKDK